MSSEMREIAREMRAQALDGQTQDWRPNMVALAERIEALAGIGGSVLEEMRSVSPHQDVYGDVVLAWADRLERALLARTEAGADGAVAEVTQSFDGSKKIGSIYWDRLEVGDRLYLRPQDASGDAERFAAVMNCQWLRSSKYGDQVLGWREEFLSRVNAEVAAMQAKEAK